MGADFKRVQKIASKGRERTDGTTRSFSPFRRGKTEMKPHARVFAFLDRSRIARTFHQSEIFRSPVFLTTRSFAREIVTWQLFSHSRVMVR